MENQSSQPCKMEQILKGDVVIITWGLFYLSLFGGLCLLARL